MSEHKELFHHNWRLIMLNNLRITAYITGRQETPVIKNLLRAIAVVKDDTKAVRIYKKAMNALQMSPEFIAAATSRLPFSCPPANLINGEIQIGAVFDPVRRCMFPFGLRLQELRQHTQIIGRSGSGKTTLIIAVLYQMMEQQIPFFCFDFKRDYRSLLRHGNPLVLRWNSTFKFNPFMPPPSVDFISWLVIVRDVFFDIFFPGYPAESTKSVFFETALRLQEKNGKLNFFDFADELRLMLTDKSVSSTTKERAKAMLNRLEPMLHIIGGVLDCNEGYSIPSLMERPVVLELDGLGSECQNLLCGLISQYMFFYRMNANQRGGKASFIVIDEAHRLLSGSNKFIGEFIRLSREFGLGIIYASQTLDDIDNCVLSNTYSIIALSITGAKDRNAMFGAMGLNAEQSDVLNSLPMKQAVVKLAGRWMRPFLVRLPEMHIDKNISDAEVAMRMKDIIATLKFTPRKAEKGASSTTEIHEQPLENPSTDPAENGVLPENELAALRDIRDRAFIPVAERIHNLGLTNHTGTKTFRLLLDAGYITEVKVKTSRRGRPQVFYELTNEGEKIVGPQQFGDGGGKGGLEHVFYQRRLKDFFASQGCTAIVEEFRNGKACDLGLVHYGKNIAVEIVCSNPGKELSNIEKDIAAGWGEIWMLASTQEYLDAVRNAWDAQPDDKKASATIEFYLVNDSRFYTNGKTEDERSSDKE